MHRKHATQAKKAKHHAPKVHGADAKKEPMAHESKKAPPHKKAAHKKHHDE